MVSSRWLFFLSAIFMLTNLAVAQSDEPLYHFCLYEKGNYTANSTYESNLNQLLSSDVSSDTGSNSGFYNFSYGQNPNQVHAIGLCRGDVDSEVCRDCLNRTKSLFPKLCPNQKEAIVGYDYCMFRYSNRSIYGVMETSPPFFLWNPNTVLDNYVEKFNGVLWTLMENLTSQAKDGGSLRKFAANNASAPQFKTLYALVQCTPDLSMDDCEDCLRGAKEAIPQCCDRKRGGRVVWPSCNIRFETYPFLDVTTDASAPPANNATPTGKGSNSSRTIILVVAIVVSVVLIFWICTCIYLRMRKQRKKVENKLKIVDEINDTKSLQIDFNTIRVATNNFSDVNKLGQGGFGTVYKGKFPNGQEIAVKRLSRSSEQGNQEFKNEILLVAKLQHRNLVRLLGFCFEGNERLLVYELMPNASLDHFIFDPSKRLHLDWKIRYKIIMGIARGLQYLHEDSQFRIIHRDLKTSNILLDEEMNSKISDFGMARLFTLDQTQANTRRIVGTYGYMAPEYAMHGHFSVKSDVFSYGVLVLEMVCGQKNNYFQNGENTENLLSHAWKNWRDGTASNLIDSTLRVCSTTEIMRCIHIGLLCVQENMAERPTMALVLLMLNSYSTALSIPSRPAFLMHSIVESDMSLNLSFQASQNEGSMTDPYPR
ncbi:hypothetical protein I3843_10G065100 [Carya illinoinensis]|nr:hypothetical protein I3843_10G065100 [Carya illinoinensis]